MVRPGPRRGLKRLIVSGDDFGLAVPVNEAIERAHTDGILGSTSLMVGAPAADDAVARARRLPSLKVGLHVVVVRGRPMLCPADVADLVGADGDFLPHLVRAGFNFLRPRARRQLASEIRAQFEAYRRTGLPLDHVDAHNHMHVHPTVLSLILEVGRDYGVRAVRLPREPVRVSWRAARRRLAARLAARAFLAPWLALMERRLDRAGLSHNDWIFGMTDTGRMTESLVLAQLAHLPPGLTEIYFHPATSRWKSADPLLTPYQFEAELKALTSPAVAGALRTHGLERTVFGDLTPPRR
jgi:hopanoid biosynthesis associated protein HpnK